VERHIGKQHHGIQDLVEVGSAHAVVPVIGTHAAAAIDEQQDALIALVLEFGG